jgi:uridine kinase
MYVPWFNLGGLLMPVPNTLTRIINKKGEIVAFDLSRVEKSIAAAIRDVENCSDWESKARSLKYAEEVRLRTYRNFYDLNHVAEFFGRMISSFKPEEREERLTRKEFAPRLTSLLLLHYLHPRKKSYLEKKDRPELHEFIGHCFARVIPDKSILPQMTEIFTDKAFAKSEIGLDDLDQYPTRSFVQDMIEQTLKDIGEIALAEGFMIFREGKRKIKQGEISEAQFTHNGIHKDRLRATLLWNVQNECDSVFALNDWVTGRNGKNFKELMTRSNQRFYDDIALTVQKIIARAHELKVVVIAGPSCSNKTTTTAVMEQELSKHGLKLKQLNIDDYFFNLSQHPKDEFGDYDYEMPEAIDIKLLNENLADLLLGKVIKKPRYNFKTGMRDGYKEFSVAKDEIILIDCLHGLFKALTESVPAEKKFKIYTESANMLRTIEGAYTMWSDVRLTKRMIRDSLYRAYDPMRTLEHWVYVRKGELKHIIPYIHSVDAVLNAGLPYELPILKTVLKDKLPRTEHLHKLRLQGRLDAYIRGMRLNALMESVVAWENVDDVSPYSPIREFIGGSAYQLAHNE